MQSGTFEEESKKQAQERRTLEKSIKLVQLSVFIVDKGCNCVVQNVTGDLEIAHNPLKQTEAEFGGSVMTPVGQCQPGVENSVACETRKVDDWVSVILNLSHRLKDAASAALLHKDNIHTI